MYKKIKKDPTSAPYEVTVFNKADLSKMIADDLQINREIVDSILNRLVDIAIELTANHNIIKFTSLFILEPKIVLKPKSFKRVDGKDALNGAHVELKARPSPVLKELHKLQQQVFYDTPYVVTRDSWRGARKWWLEQLKKERAERSEKPSDEGINLRDGFMKDHKNINDNFDDNPFLNDDED